MAEEESETARTCCASVFPGSSDDKAMTAQTTAIRLPGGPLVVTGNVSRAPPEGSGNGGVRKLRHVAHWCRVPGDGPLPVIRYAVRTFHAGQNRALQRSTSRNPRRADAPLATQVAVKRRRSPDARIRQPAEGVPIRELHMKPTRASIAASRPSSLNSPAFMVFPSQKRQARRRVASPTPSSAATASLVRLLMVIPATRVRRKESTRSRRVRPRHAIEVPANCLFNVEGSRLAIRAKRPTVRTGVRLMRAAASAGPRTG